MPNRSMTEDDQLEDFDSRVITLEGVAKVVHVAGSGQGVIVMTEMPGISPQVARFSRWVRDAGFTVYMPSLFGRDGAVPVSRRARWRTRLEQLDGALRRSWRGDFKAEARCGRDDPRRRKRSARAGAARQDLVDELRLMVFPVVLGSGKRLCGERSDKHRLRLSDSKIVGDGIAILTYEPA